MAVIIFWRVLATVSPIVWEKREFCVAVGLVTRTAGLLI